LNKRLIQILILFILTCFLTPAFSETTTKELDDIEVLIKNQVSVDLDEVAYLSNELTAVANINTSNVYMNLEKKVNKNYATIGDTIIYEITISNISEFDISDIDVNDMFPKGMRYKLNSAKLDGESIDNPVVLNNNAYKFKLHTTLSPRETIKLSYSAIITASIKKGVNVNAAVATAQVVDKSTVFSNFCKSNISEADINIDQDIFDSKAILIGTVFYDINENGMQEVNEPGIPSVRLLLNNGISVYTDVNGKYSIYGLEAKNHVLKIDKASLPSGTKIVINSNLFANTYNTRFVDLKKNSLKSVDLAIVLNKDIAKDEIESRKEAIKNKDFLLDAFNSTISLDDTQSKNNRSKGVVDVAESKSEQKEVKKSDVPFDDSLKGLPEKVSKMIMDNQLDVNLNFVNIEDGYKSIYGQEDIIVKGILTNDFRLFVNDVEFSKVGVKYVDSNKLLAVWQYIGVDLSPGKNVVRLEAVSKSGKVTGTKEITIYSPGVLSKLEIVKDNVLYADGKTVNKIQIIPKDADGLVIGRRLPITIKSSINDNVVMNDMDKNEDGLQGFIDAGKLTLPVLSVSDVGEYNFTVNSNYIEEKFSLNYNPPKRDLIMSGIGELSYGENNGFFDESTIDKNKFGARLAFYASGSLNNDVLLTASYDSNKNEDALFRDIKPYDYFPIYGDSSIREYDAQSSSAYYVKVEQKQSYLMLGDYQTSSDIIDSRSLLAYNRSLNGFKGYYSNKNLKLEGFLAYDDSLQFIDEIAANGTSGPYHLSKDNIVENSDIVKIIVKDKNSPSNIVSEKVLTRYYDYYIDFYSGEIITKEPLSSYDTDLNPIYLKVSYEVESNGDKFLTTSLRTKYDISKNLTLAASMVSEDNPVDKYTMGGASLTFDNKKDAKAILEFANTNKDSIGSGNAYRFDADYKTDKIDAKLKGIKSDGDFSNSNSPVFSSGIDAEAKIKAKLDNTKSLNFESTYIQNDDTDKLRNTFDTYIEQRLKKNLTFDYGLRYIRDDDTLNGDTLKTFKIKLTHIFENFKNAPLYVEYEQNIDDWSEQTLAVGGTYDINNKMKAYARYEFISDLNGLYASQESGATPSTFFGIESKMFSNGKAYSEYRSKDDGFGEDVEAVVGLKNSWTLKDGLSFSGSFEKIKVIKSDTEKDDPIAITGSIEYNKHPKFISRLKVEHREGDSKHWLYNVDFAYKFSDKFSGITKFIMDNNEDSDSVKNNRYRGILGFAYRDNYFNGLLKYESKKDYNETSSDNSDRNINIISLAANYKMNKTLSSDLYLAYKNVNGTQYSEDAGSKATLFGFGLTKELNNRLSVGTNFRTLDTKGSIRENGYGFELGYILANDLLLKVGYNITGFKDGDFSVNNTDKGLYLNIGFKFDESLIKRK